MTVRLFAFTCGWLTGPMGGFLRGEEGRLRVPVPAYWIDHPSGTVLFDSGLHPDAGRDPEGRLGVASQVFEVELGDDENVAARLERMEVDPARVTHLVNSHLHFDHTGGNACLPNARLVVQRREWEAGMSPEGQAANHFRPQDYDLGHDVNAVDGEHDLFGDGSVVCVPTYGHTPGHQSLRVRTDEGEVVLAGDACYLRHTLEALHLPGICFDDEAALASLHRLRALRDRGARILYGHDPELWKTLPNAPDPIG